MRNHVNQHVQIFVMKYFLPVNVQQPPQQPHVTLILMRYLIVHQLQHLVKYVVYVHQLLVIGNHIPEHLAYVFKQQQQQYRIRQLPIQL